MKSFEKESLLRDPVIRYVWRRSFTRIESEVQFYEFKMDLYGFSRRLDLTIAIELKLYKWKRAFEQALLYQLCADLVFVAVPKEIVPRVDVSQLRASGIGLIGVSADRCRQILPALTSAVVRPHYRDSYLERMGCHS